VFLLLMVLIGSSTATAAKFAVRELPLGLVPLARFGIAGLCLLPVVLRRGRFMRLLREDWRRLLVAALFCVPINQTFFLGGTRLAPTTHVGLIYAMCPLVVLVMATAIGQERLVAGRVLGIATTVAGALVIALGNLFNGGGAGGQATLWGDLLLLGAVVSWGAYLTTNKPLVQKHGSLEVLAGTFLLGSLLELPITLATMPSWPPLGGVSRAAWLGLLHMAVIVTVIGLACQNAALRRFDASQVATVGNAAPLLTILWGVWLLGESITPTLIIGGVLILGGILETGRSSATARPVGTGGVGLPSGGLRPRSCCHPLDKPAA
jgi:drug/metabolite transporter (DMT)-like permease